MRKLCPLRVRAHAFLMRLFRLGMGDTAAYNRLAAEFDRDLYTGESRLHLALPKVEPLLAAVDAAGRKRKPRREALAALRAARPRVR